MSADHDIDANAGPIKPCRSPTSSRASTEVDYKDQPDDQLQQGKRRREDQIQGERKRKIPCRASRSPNRKQEEGCHTTSAIDLTGEGFCQMNGADSDLSLRAKLLECKKDIDLWRKLCFEVVKNHSKVNDKLDALQKRKDRQVRNLKAEIRWFRGRNKQLAQENKQLAQENKQLEKSHGSVLGLYLGLLNSQRTDQLMTEKNEHDESSAREKKDEEIRQRGRDAEELKNMIQGINNVGQLVLEIGKQQSQAIREMTEGIRKMNREQYNYIYPFYAPTRPNDGSLPVIPGLDLSAPPACYATNQQQMPVLSSSPDNVNFGPSYNGRFAYPVSSPQTPMLSPRSSDRGGISLQVPSLQGYQNASWQGSSNY